MPSQRSIRLLAASLALLAAGCSRTDVFAGSSATTITVSPATATVEVGRSAVFTATLTRPAPNGTSSAILWMLANSSVGTLDTGTPSTIVYTAPLTLPDTPEGRVVTLRAFLAGTPVFGETFADAKITLVPSTTGPPARLQKVSGDNQVAVVGTQLATSLVVKVVDAAGIGVPGVPVSFESDGEATPLVRVTDSSGEAEAAPRAGTAAGAKAFNVTSDGLNTVVFSVTLKAGPLAVIAATHPTKTGQAGTTLVDPVVVTFFDQFQNPIEGRTAEKDPNAGSVASASPLDPVSNAAGEQRFTVTLAATPGEQALAVHDTEFPQFSDSLIFTALGGPAASIELVSGDGQDGVVDAALAQPIVVRLLDANGAPAGAGTLAWSSPDGATFTAPGTAPGADGTASAQVTLGGGAGIQRVVVDAGAITGSPLTVTIRAKAGPAQRLQLVAGGNQTTTALLAFGGAFSVRATDAHTNGVAGVTVLFETLAGGGSVAPAAVTTGVDGLAQATMTAGPAGPQRYRARVAGLIGSPIDVNNTAVAPVPITLELLSGNNQTARVLTDLPAPLVLRVMQGTTPLANRTVNFAVALGDGSVRPVSVTTTTDGRASTTARLGGQPGPQRFAASVAGATNSPIFFDATATGRNVSALRLVSGGTQTAAPGAALPAPFVVEALDDTGAVVPNASLAFVSSAGGSVTPSAATTGADGRATATGTLGPANGAQTFLVTATGGATLTINATASVATTGRRLAIGTGNNQTAQVGLALALPLEVKLTNDGGGPIEGATVTFRAEAELATVSPTTAVTDAQGLARTAATLGKPLGTQRFFAEVTGATNSPVVFSATGTAAPADRIVVASGDGQSALVNATLTRPLVARVVDRVGNPISGVAVTFRTGPAGGTVTPNSAQTTSAAGEAQVTAKLGGTVGPQTFFSDAAGLTTPAAFTATATNTVDRISISPQGQQLEVGGAVKYTAVAIYSDGTSSPVTEDATWVSVTPATASVSDTAGSKGVVKALAAGTTIVRATYSGKVGETTLKVVAATLVSIVVTPADVTMIRGSTLQFRALGTFSNNSVVEVTESATWTSSATAIATVSDTSGSKGLVKGVALGTSTLSAKVGTVTGTRAVTVSQSPLAVLEVTPVNVIQPAGTAATFRATATYEDGTVEDVTAVATWSSSDTALMTLQNAPATPGRATFIAAGTPNAIATYGGKTALQKVTITQATVTGITLLPRQIDLAVRDFFQIRLIATYSDGTVTDAANLATWSSSAPAIADVSNATGSQGVVTAIAQGRAVITARIGTQTATMDANVTNATLLGLRIFQGQVGGGGPGGGGAVTVRCPAGTTVRLAAGALYSNGPADISDQASWSSSNPAIAIVGQGAVNGGIVQCLAQGTVTITAAWSGQSATAQAIVTAATLSTITLAPTSAQLAKGDLRKFFATGRYSDGTNRDLTTLVTWSSSNTAVLTVSNAPSLQGNASAIAPGTANVVASLDGVTGQAAVTVSGASLIFVIIAPANQVVRLRDRFAEFTATALYDDGTTNDVTDLAVWTSDNPAVGIVSNDPQTIGTVVVTGVGTANVAATYGGKKGQTSLTVRQ